MTFLAKKRMATAFGTLSAEEGLCRVLSIHRSLWPQYKLLRWDHYSHFIDKDSEA